MNPVTLILVGGFLGAGKTTLLWEAARRLASRGRRAGLITNDQAPDLVDSGLLARQGLDVQEVAGSCFCCNFPGLIRAAESLQRDAQADVLLAEPVGSCTDLSATVLQPLKAFYGDRLRVGPFSVLVDPARARVLTEDRGADEFAANVNYIFRKQIEEADLVVLNKVDLLAPGDAAALRAALAAELPGRQVLGLSALTGDGLDAWLDAALSGAPAGLRLAEVDYQAYADGEAALGWLNASVALHAEGPLDWREFAARLMGNIQEALRGRRAAVAHLKLLLTTPSGFLAANLASTDGRPTFRGAADRPEAEAVLVLNARVQIDPATLQDVVTRSLVDAAGTRVTPRVKRLASFSPTPPKPTRRFDRVIGE